MIKTLEKETSQMSKLDGIKLITKNEYTSVLRKYLPEECFKPDTKHVFHYLFFMSAVLLGLYAIANLQIFPLKLVISIFVGISLGALTFFLHDLCHGSIVQSKPISYLLGLSVGIFNLFAPTFWQRVHNFHHARTGNIDDPDRSYIFAERPKSPIQKFVYKTRMSNEAFNPLLSLILISTGFFWYFLNTMFNSFYAGRKYNTGKKFSRVHELFTRKYKSLVIFELVLIIAFQVFLFNFVAGKSFLNYFLISILPVAICHFIAMSYIHTNHFLSPLTGEVDDPLINSLSLKNSKLVDKIFSNFSHHVEHHLFPSMGSVHYPKVRKLLREFYASRFQLIPMVDAIKLLFKTPRIYSEDLTHLISVDGNKKYNCLLPSN